jgi:predicted dienelactone hydrolase
LASALLLVIGDAAATTMLPTPDGAYPVGMRRFELTDPARHGVVSPDADEPRVLPGYVWYPAKRGTRGTRPYLTPAEAADQGRAMARNFKYDADELTGLDKTSANSVEGAPPARGRAFPIVIFNHGYECYPAQNTALLERLASHGYIVMSIGHPHDAADMRLADGELLTTSHPAGNDAEYAALRKMLTSGPSHDARTAALRGYAPAFSRDRLGASFIAWRDDTLFIARSIEKRAVPPELIPILATGDPQRLGFMGMSFGGAVAASTCKRVKQCRVVVNLDGSNYDPDLFNATVERPLLLMMSDWVHLPLPNRPSDPDFNFNDYAYETWPQAGLNPDVVRLRLDGIRHMGYTDLILLLDGPEHESRFGTIAPLTALEAISAAALAFLDQYLKDGHRKTLDEVIERMPVLRIHSPVSVRQWASGKQ